MNPEARLQKRDSAALYDSLGAVYLSPADGFDELAPTYDQRLAGNPLFALESRAVLSALPDLSGKRIADIGCGTGRYALQLARMGAASVVGVDLSPEMLAVATRKATRGDLGDFVTWRRGDLLERLRLAERGTGGAADTGHTRGTGRRSTNRQHLHRIAGAKRRSSCGCRPVCQMKKRAGDTEVSCPFRLAIWREATSCCHPSYPRPSCPSCHPFCPSCREPCRSA